MIFILCGVAGSGKSTIGRLLAETLDSPFYDADDFHCALNLKKMSNDVPLNEEDRLPWLEQLATKLAEWQTLGGAVLACSALKESYRVKLESQCREPLQWIVLSASETQLKSRLRCRKNHFFSETLLESQLATFETPHYGWHLDVTSRPEIVVENILELLRNP